MGKEVKFIASHVLRENVYKMFFSDGILLQRILSKKTKITKQNAANVKA